MSAKEYRAWFESQGPECDRLVVARTYVQAAERFVYHLFKPQKKLTSFHVIVCVRREGSDVVYRVEVLLTCRIHTTGRLLS